MLDAVCGGRRSLMSDVGGDEQKRPAFDWPGVAGHVNKDVRSRDGIMLHGRATSTIMW